MNDSKKNLHDRAMYLADEGLSLRQSGEHEAALEKFVQAFELESRVAELISAETQPGHGILHRSAATLALDANRMDAAAKLIRAGLAGGPIESIRAELVELDQLVKPSWENERIAGYPGVLPQQVLNGLALLLPDLFMEVAMTGRHAKRPVEIHAADYQSGIFVYEHRNDFHTWKVLSDDLNALPARIYIKAERQRKPEQIIYPTVRVFGEVPDALASMLNQVVTPAPFSPFGYRSEAA